MTKSRVLVVGATGRTGRAIVDGLLEAGETEVDALVRPASRSKPSVINLKDRGVRIHVAEITDSVELDGILAGIDTVISAIGPSAQLEQIPLADAAKKSGVKRFVPCSFMTICPPGGVMWTRDQKEEVYQHVRKLGLPYTVIDVGYWYQFSFPTLPSGRLDYVGLPIPNVTIFGDGKMKTILTDLRDIGLYVSKIVTDDRTLNKFVICCGASLSQEEIFAQLEDLSGEQIQRQVMPASELVANREAAKTIFRYDFSDMKQAITVITLDYAYSKFVRGDNSPEYGKYLGYLDARDLYPKFVPRQFETFVKELLDGTAARVSS